jgi:hypothetical protein
VGITEIIAPGEKYHPTGTCGGVFFSPEKVKARNFSTNQGNPDELLKKR